MLGVGSWHKQAFSVNQGTDKNTGDSICCFLWRQPQEATEHAEGLRGCREEVVSYGTDNGSLSREEREESHLQQREQHDDRKDNMRDLNGALCGWSKK